MDLSIVIVSYNTRALLEQTLDSVYKSISNHTFEVIVSDNGSTDDSVIMVRENFPSVMLIENNCNFGFSKGNNIAIKESKGRNILLLNSDTVIINDCIDRCIDYIDSKNEIGALGCKVVLRDGSLDLACRRSFPTPMVSFYRMLGLSTLFPKNKKFGKYNLTYLDEHVISEVDCVVGAFMMVPRAVVDRVGILDEEFFMYGEDVDWCYRIKEDGWKIIYYPDVKIVHYKGASGGKKNPRIIYEFYRSMYLFYDKHFKRMYPFWITLLVYSGIALKLFLSQAINLLNLRKK